MFCVKCPWFIIIIFQLGFWKNNFAQKNFFIGNYFALKNSKMCPKYYEISNDSSRLNLSFYIYWKRNKVINHELTNVAVFKINNRVKNKIKSKPAGHGKSFS